MKVLIVSASDINGGAARAAYRLHVALLSRGLKSQMLVQAKYSDDHSVIGPETKVKKAVGMARPTVDLIPVRGYQKSTATLFSPSWVPFSSLAEKINALNPDIVHLHWIAGGMFRIEDLSKIKKPIVWSLHDMWAFTGGCHYDNECSGYKAKCGFCPVLGSKKEKDLSRKVWIRKHKTFSTLQNCTIIGLSKWLTECARESSLFADRKVVNIPNPIDTSVFSPFSKSKARQLLALPQDKQLVLFGAMSAVSDPRKGFGELIKSLDNVSQECELVVFGSSKPRERQGFKQKAHYLGQLHDDVSLRLAYSAADVMVVPSLQENLANTIVESLACGTPVVAFGIGGNADLIVHKKSGYLAHPFDTKDLGLGIRWVLEHENLEKLAEFSREKIVREFDSELVAERCVAIYEKLAQVAI